jgi:alpha-D-xyloside xylohydrolase
MSSSSIWDEVRASYDNMYLDGEERKRNIKVLLENGEDILGVERRKFEHVHVIDSYHRDKGDLVLECRTSRGRSVRVRLSLFEHGIFRLRLYSGDEPPSRGSIPGLREPRRSKFTVKRTGEAIALTAGELSLRVKQRPWSLELLDSSGRTLRKDITIQEYAGGTFAGEHAPVVGFPEGPLGFLTDGEGNVSVYEFMWLFPDEHVYGFGEKFTPLDKRGQRIVSWNNNPLSNENPRTYKNVPFFMSSMGFGTLINSSSLAIHQIGHPHQTSCSFEVKSDSLDVYVFLGPSFKRILRSYHSVTGAPAVPPKWSFGLGAGGWMPSREETEKLARRLRRLRIPCDMIHSGFVGERRLHSSFEWGPAFPSPREMITHLRRDGFRYLLYISPDVPEITEMFREGDTRGYFIRGNNGATFIANLPYGRGAQVDFSHPGAVRWYKEKLREQMKTGVAGFFADYGEAAPVDGVYHDGSSGKEMHNLYPLLYTRTVHEAVAGFYGRALNWARPSYGPAQRYPIQWDGDPGCNFPSMACVLRAGLSYGLSGVPFWSHEIGGFLGKPSKECYVRWLQFGAFTSHSRIFGWQTTRREPWEFGEEAVEIFRKYFSLKYRLIPYIYSHALAARTTGLPLLRAMVLEFQDDPNCYGKEMQYFFGREFLVAPVFTEDGTVTVYLPEGRWVDYWTKREYEGPANLRLKVPLSTLPLFVRGDSIIPMAPLAYTVKEGLPDHLTLDIYCHREAEFQLLDDGARVELRCRREEKRIVLTAGPSGLALEAVFNNVPRPAAVIADGGELRRRKTEKEYERCRTGWTFSRGIVKVKCATRGQIEIALKL